MQTLIIEEAKLENLLQSIEDLKNMYSSLLNFRETNKPKLVYSNKEIQDVLGVGDKLVRQYRKNGLLGYHQVGDKFFYKEEDILQFLEKHHHKPYAYDYK